MPKIPVPHGSARKRQEVPATEEKQHKQRRAHDDVRVLRHEEQAKLERTILRVETTDQVGLGLRHVKGQTIGFGKQCDQKDQRRQRLPQREPQVLLALYHAEQAHAVIGTRCGRPDEYRQDRQPHGQLVGNHLRRRTDCSEEGILRVGGPTGKDDSIYPKRGNAENEEHADIEIGQHRSAEPHHRHQNSARTAAPPSW